MHTSNNEIYGAISEISSLFFVPRGEGRFLISFTGAVCMYMYACVHAAQYLTASWRTAGRLMMHQLISPSRPLRCDSTRGVTHHARARVAPISSSINELLSAGALFIVRVRPDMATVLYRPLLLVNAN